MSFKLIVSILNNLCYVIDIYVICNMQMREIFKPFSDRKNYSWWKNVIDWLL